MRWLNNFWNFKEFWLVHYVECPNDSTTYCNLQKGVILCIIIGDVHQLIGHCLILLDPSINVQIKKENKNVIKYFFMNLSF